MSKPFEFKVDEDAKPLTKKEAMEAEMQLIRWAFADTDFGGPTMKCETCLNSRPIISENGFHRVCCLSERAAWNCIIGKKDRYVEHPMLKERDGNAT